jgi:hypothetical protein
MPKSVHNMTQNLRLGIIQKMDWAKGKQEKKKQTNNIFALFTIGEHPLLI